MILICESPPWILIVIQVGKAQVALPRFSVYVVNVKVLLNSTAIGATRHALGRLTDFIFQRI